MGEFILLPASIFTLHTNELLLIIAGALLSGYLMKLLFNRVWSRSQKDDNDELQTELETLQNKYSAEMIKKEEESKLLQEEVKESEKKNFDLQIQYAKALNHIEKVKAGLAGDETDENNSGVTSSQVLHNLQEKITMQEENLLHLEQRLAQTEQERNELETQHLQETTAVAAYKELIEVQQKGYEEKLTSSAEREEQLLLQLDEAGKSNREEQLQQEIQGLQSSLNEKSMLRDSENAALHKDGIAVIRSEAEQVSEKIEQFRDHLTNILRDAYSYEQLLASNERLHQTTQQLQQEKHSAEEQIGEYQQIQQSMLFADAERKELIDILKQQINDQQSTIEELNQIKTDLQESIHELNSRLTEKERISREMIHAVKDIEHRFGGMYESREDGGAAVAENGEIHYR